MATQSCRVSFPHVLSAELNQQKGMFISQTARPRQLFKNIFDVSHEAARNELTAKMEAPDGGREPQCYCNGFSCQTVSGLNSNKAAAASAIEEGAGTTGSTFAGGLFLLARKRPKVAILENVMGLLNHGLDQQVVRRVEQ